MCDVKTIKNEKKNEKKRFFLKRRAEGGEGIVAIKGDRLVTMSHRRHNMQKTEIGNGWYEVRDLDAVDSRPFYVNKKLRKVRFAEMDVRSSVTRFNDARVARRDRNNGNGRQTFKIRRKLDLLRSGTEKQATVRRLRERKNDRDWRSLRREPPTSK